MSYEVLARKWRPQIFQEVVGQEHVTQTLMNAIVTGRLAQAYLFSGARGVGKTSVARIFAKALNCREGEPGVPCNRCRSCLEITDGSSVDVQEIDGASNRGIDEIRELRENIRYMPSSSPYRVYIIDEVHMLTLPAFNALLKTLEEPPPHVKFIFATTEPHKVPVTILSRCQRFDFKRIPLPKIVDHLANVSREEGISISPEALAVIARAAGGSMRDGQSLLDQVVAFTGQAVEDARVVDILGVVDRSLVFETGRALIEGDPGACLRIVDAAYNSGYDIKEFYRTLMEHFRNLMVSLVSSDEGLLEMSASEREETRAQAKKAGQDRVQMILNFLVVREETLRYASSPRLVLETLLVKLCQLGEYLSFEGIIQRLEALEKGLPEGAGTAHDVSAPVNQPVRTAKDLSGVENALVGETKTAGMEAWPQFLRFLSGRNRPMGNILKDWTCRSIGEHEVELVKSRQPFTASYFEDADHVGQLSDHMEAFFRRRLKIRIIDSPDRVLKPDSPPPRSESSSRKRYAHVSPPVQDILNIFEGRIEGDVTTAADAGGVEPETEEEDKT
ncbi:DNA polymerase III subunit gamma/tau [Desulfatiglans anilini]|uniref:DNA polymerase III subunit gamma/tau n=1 Tax=Desulfatiglans anilini TaxID=90728 RepID=UPI000421C4E4|nr:DNA polymerase III subunit gamma/tau [Desulfatiglans anilini]